MPTRLRGLRKGTPIWIPKIRDDLCLNRSTKDCFAGIEKCRAKKILRYAQDDNYAQDDKMRESANY
jgi:hypothetical protein